MSNRLLVIGWHNIEPTPAFPGTAGARGFEKQVRFLSRVANVIRLSEAAERIAAGEPLPPRAVALTFDDGYTDNLEVATPILNRYQAPGTFFLVPGFLDGRLGAWWEDFAHAVDTAQDEVLEWGGERWDLRRTEERARAKAELPGRLKELDARTREDEVARIAARISPTPNASLFMGWDGARQLLAAGQEIGSHSMTHVILSNETESVQAEELHASRKELEAGLGTPVETLAYPNGRSIDYDTTSTRVAREVGYKVAVTVEPGLADRRDDPYQLRRLVVTPDDDLSKFFRKAVRQVREKVASRAPFLKGALRV
jgi:peptidoglycan/xylan/chitin deacetylase (PgdA/CDA1 family)